MSKKKRLKKRFCILPANSINKEDIETEATSYKRYEEIDEIRKAMLYNGQKTLKVQTLPHGRHMRITYFQERKFFIKVERELVFLGDVPNTDPIITRAYKKVVDIEASKKFLEYIGSLSA